MMYDEYLLSNTLYTEIKIISLPLAGYSNLNTSCCVSIIVMNVKCSLVDILDYLFSKCLSFELIFNSRKY